jgi:DNA-binding response OmpR family regulator/chromosome segregation ATPase
MSEPEQRSQPDFSDLLQTHSAFAQRLEELRRHTEVDLRQRETDLQHATEELRALNDELKILRATNERQATDLAALQNAQIQWAVDREAMLAQAREREEAEARAYREYTARVAQLTGERDLAAGQLQQQLQELTTVRAQAQAVRDTIKGLEEQQAAWQKDRKQLVADLGRVEQQGLDATAELKGERSAHQELKLSHVQLTRDLEAFERREAQRHQQVTLMQKQIEGFESERQDARKAQERLEAGLRESQEAVKASETKLDQKRREQEQWSEAQASLLAEMMSKDEAASAREKALLADKKKLSIDLERLQVQLSEGSAQMQATLRQKQNEWAELEVAFKREKEDLRRQIEELKKAVAGERNRQQQDVAAAAKDWDKEREALHKQIESLKVSLAEEEVKSADPSRTDAVHKDVEAKFRIIYDQSHDLNSPLNAIIGFSEVLLDDKDGRVTAEERKEFLQNIHHSGKDLLEHIRELIDFAKEEAGIVEKPVPEPPAREKRNTAGPVLPSSRQPVILVADNDPAVKERIQPFLNHAGYELVYATTAQEALRMAVQLQPLAILVETQLPPKGGSALLYDLKREVKTRDIPVVLTSKVNKEQLGFDIANSDFLVKPIDRQQLLQMMVKFDLLADKKTVKGPRKILLVDDDPQNITLVKAMLRPFAFTFLSARGGKEGIKIALAEKPDLIILDLMMPDVDGFEVVQALKKDPDLAHCPILIYTAKNITSEDRARLQGNIESIIQKGDFGKDRFLELINGLQAEAQAS